MITILLFASVADAVGSRRVEIEAAEGDTVATVRDRLVAQYPGLKPYVENLMYAVDETYADAGTPVAEGATLALIPPVSGG